MSPSEPAPPRQVDAARPIARQDRDFAVETFSSIAFIRAFEAKVLELSQTAPPIVAGSAHLCAGQEAVPLGAIAGLREDDQIISTYRGHGWALGAGLAPADVMAEICHRATGLNGGRAGSAYFMAPGTRFIGENSIVGAGTTIACGLALANLSAGNGRVVAVSIGDGAMNQGAVHEAMAFAAAKALPVIFVVENNGWSELTATSDMFRSERLAQRAAAYGFPGATISGVDPIAVRDSFALAAERCRKREGPVLIECRVPRLWGHYNRDIEHYRSKEDRRKAEAQDPLFVFGQRLVAAGFLSEAEIASEIERQRGLVDTMTEKVLKAPLPEAADAATHVVDVASSNPHVARPASTVTMTYVAAVNAALRELLEDDPATVVYGEDVGKAGGIFGASRNLQRDFGEARVFDTPIAENAILGSAVGAALGGLRPIVEVMWADFVLVAIDQLINQAANVRYVTQGRSSVPMVVRMQQGATPGSCPQHSQSIEALLAHIPGLKLALAATPQDAYSLLRSAAADPDPCVVIEARSLYQTRGEVTLGGVVEPAGKARLCRKGSDALILSWGAMVNRAMEAAERLAPEISVSVLDLRWLSPLDETAVREAVGSSGGRVLVVHEAVRTGGFGAEIVARIHESCGSGLRGPVRRLATPDVRIPASPVLQAALIPDSSAIASAVRSMVEG
ncbi:MAG TPA: thiamine pyrophosphate-dependent enzyme [Rhizobiaceae bacterium]